MRGPDSIRASRRGKRASVPKMTVFPKRFDAAIETKTTGAGDQIPKGWRDSSADLARHTVGYSCLQSLLCQDVLLPCSAYKLYPTRKGSSSLEMGMLLDNNHETGTEPKVMQMRQRLSLFGLRPSTFRAASANQT
jgi:hypothetical protein